MTDEQRLRGNRHATDALPDKCESHQHTLRVMLLLVNKMSEQQKTIAKSERDFRWKINGRIKYAPLSASYSLLLSRSLLLTFSSTGLAS